MQQNEVSKKSDNKKCILFRKIMSFGIKCVVIFAILAAIFLVVLSNSQSARQYFIGKLTDIANNFLIADVKLNDIHLLGLNGIALQEVQIITANDTLASIPEIEINLNFEEIFRGNIDINYLKLKSPRIKLLRSLKDSLWNYDKIVAPSTDTTVSTEPTKLKFNIKEIVLENAYFAMWDSVASEESSGKINFEKFVLSNLNTKIANTNICLENMRFVTSIENLSATEEVSGCNIKQLAVDAELSSDKIEAKNLKLNLDDSKIECYVKLENYDLFSSGNEDIEKALMELQLSSDKFNPEVIDYFSIMPVRIGKVENMEISVNGTLGELNVDKILLDTYDSHIKLSECKLTNLLEPDSLTYSGVFKSTKINRNYLPKILKNIDLTAIPNIGKVKIDELRFFGTVDSIYSKLDIKTDLGAVFGNVEVGFGKQPFSYNINLDTRNLNIGKIINKPEIYTSLNTSISFVGKGIEEKQIFAKLEADILPSKLLSYNLGQSKLQCQVDGDTLVISNIDIVVLENPNIFEKIDNSAFGGTEILIKDTVRAVEKSRISIVGGIGIKSFDSPHFSLDLGFSNINLEELFVVLDENNADFAKNLPVAFDSQISLDMQGIDVNEMLGDFYVDLTRVNFHNKSLLPMQVVGKFSNDEVGKTINLECDNIFSDIFSVTINGNYKLTDLIDNILDHSKGVAKFINDKVEVASSQISAEKQVETTLYTKQNFQNLDANIKLDIRDLSFLTIFIPEFEASSLGIGAELNFTSNKNESLLKIDSLQIENLDVSYEENEFQISTLTIQGATHLNTADSLLDLDKMQISIKNGNKINIAGHMLDSLSFSTYFNGQEFLVDLAGKYSDFLKTQIASTVTFGEDKLVANVGQFDLFYYDLKWHNKNPIEANVSTDGLTIDNCKIIRDEKEEISLFGNIKSSNFNDMTVLVKNFEFNDVNQIVLEKNNQDNLNLFAQLDSLKLVLNGTFDAPVAQLDLLVKNIIYDKQKIGAFKANFNYSDEEIKGSAHVFSNDEKELFELLANSIPIYLGLQDGKPMFDNRELDVNVNLAKLPVDILSSFVPMIDNVSGLVDGKINVTGTLSDKIAYNGKISLHNLALRLLATNVFYQVSGDINLETDRIYFENLKIKNHTSDLKNGEASANGEVKLKDLNLEYLDIYLSTNKFLVMNQQTATVMPWLYGNLVIATESKPIRFFGTLTHPNLSGEVVILEADMKMPQILNSGVIKRKTKFNYINKDTIRITTISYRDTNAVDTLLQNKLASQNGEEFVDLLNIDLYVRIKNFAILLDLGNIGTIFARVGTSDPSKPIRYLKDREQPEAKILGGNIEVLEGSNVQIMRSMAARGTISFPSARISRPELNLTAEYKGRMLDNSNNYINFSVFAKILGSATNPKLTLSYALNGEEATGDRKQIEENAFILLTTGRLNGYSESASQSLVNEGANMFASQFASKTLTDLLMKTGVVQSANLQFAGDSFNSAEVKISGTIGGFANWTLGGNIGDISSNYSISIDVPIVIKSKGFDNLMLQIAKYTDINSVVFDNNLKNWEVKLKLDGSW